MIKLYQFPISHFCEKIRWALEYKKLDYVTQNLTPGAHLLTTRRISTRSSVPILDIDGIVISGSNHILEQLDNSFPDFSLTSKDKQEKAEIIKWEKYIDENIGINIRICCYQILLEYPHIVIPFLTHGSSILTKTYFKIFFPLIKMKMKKSMKINPESALFAKIKLSKAIDKLNIHYSQYDFLVGERFTRADLSAASLVAPFTMPDSYGLDWPKTLPDEMHCLIEEFTDKIQWSKKLYKLYRV